MAYEIYNHKTNETMGKEFPTKKAAQEFVKYLQAGTSLKLHWRVRKKKSSNPAKGKWIPAHAVRFNKDGSVSIMK